MNKVVIFWNNEKRWHHVGRKVDRKMKKKNLHNLLLLLWPFRDSRPSLGSACTISCKAQFSWSQKARPNGSNMIRALVSKALKLLLNGSWKGWMFNDRVHRHFRCKFFVKIGGVYSWSLKGGREEEVDGIERGLIKERKNGKKEIEKQLSSLPFNSPHWV